MKINNKIKEIEKEIEKEKKDLTFPNKEIQELAREIFHSKTKQSNLKLLKQFQKEIKELQGELKEKRGEVCNMRNNTNDKMRKVVIKYFSEEDKIFKNKFGEMNNERRTYKGSENNS